MTIANAVRVYLDELDIAYELVAHPRTYTSRDSAAAAHVPEDHIAKAVILGDERGPVMAVIPASAWIRLNALQREMDRPLELLPERDLAELFPDCRPGAIPPIGPAYGVETVADQTLFTLAKVYFEAGDHDNLVAVAGKDFSRLLSGARHGYFSHPV